MSKVHRVESKAVATPVNAYLIEGEDRVVAVDGTLTVAGGLAVRERVEDLGKPLAAVVITHAHPDHYGGVVEAVRGREVPIIATAGVDDAIRRDDAAKEEILRPMFGGEWPASRVFPTDTVEDGAELDYGGIELTVRDLGPGESPHDSVWYLGETRSVVFSGDQAYNGMHCYLADCHWKGWLANIETLLAELPGQAMLHVGHGDPGGPELLGEQRGYIETFVSAVEAADWSDPGRARSDVAAAMDTRLGTDRLRFLMELSIDPVATELGLLAQAGK